MGDPKGFINIKRITAEYRPVCERVRDCREVFRPRTDTRSRDQASRCMDCGTPFCHWGCPVDNYIPEWNDLVHAGRWKEAYRLLEATNTMPEITGRLCPATCEYACVLGINDDPVTIRENELAIVEHAFRSGSVRPDPPKVRTKKNVAVIGSGPAGLSCAVRLNRMGHTVTVFERDEKIGGILRYGIPDFKLEKHILERRIAIWKKEGVRFQTNCAVGEEFPVPRVLKEFDAVCLCGGSRKPRDLTIEGRDLGGIHFAMDYLTQVNRRNAGETIQPGELIDAKGKRVVVIGGGDTGADCVGTAHRQGASCVVQIEVLERPPECRPVHQPWPAYPSVLKTSTSHEEGGERHWAVLTKRFIGDGSRVKKLSCIKVEFPNPYDGACAPMREIPASEFEIEADLVILAVGFVHPEHEGLLKDLNIGLDERGNVKTDRNYMTSLKKVFAAGDMRRGQSLIVWAISEGRNAADAINSYLAG